MSGTIIKSITTGTMADGQRNSNFWNSYRTHDTLNSGKQTHIFVVTFPRVINFAVFTFGRSDMGLPTFRKPSIISLRLFNHAFLICSWPSLSLSFNSRCLLLLVSGIYTLDNENTHEWE